MPLYDILNEFQKGHSHMAAVVKGKPKSINNLPISDVEKSKVTDVKGDIATPLLSKQNANPETIVDIEKFSKENALSNSTPYTIEDIEEGEVIGIITLEDVFEELLQVATYSFLFFSLFICLYFVGVNVILCYSILLGVWYRIFLTWKHN